MSTNEGALGRTGVGPQLIGWNRAGIADRRSINAVCGLLIPINPSNTNALCLSGGMIDRLR
jgi:hypothetical protein